MVTYKALPWKSKTKSGVHTMIRIFIAEDDEDDLELFKSAMKEIDPDAEIVAAADGICLFENLETETPPLPDIIFLDINMPKMNGYECLTKIRKLPALKDIPVVILSTSTVKKDVDFMWEEGANCYIKKPNTIGEFRKVLKSVIDEPCPVHKRTKELFLVMPEV